MVSSIGRARREAAGEPVAATPFSPEPAHARTAPALAVQPRQQEAIDQLRAAYPSRPLAGAHRDTAHVRAGLRGDGTDPVAA